MGELDDAVRRVRNAAEPARAFNTFMERYSIEGQRYGYQVTVREPPLVIPEDAQAMVPEVLSRLRPEDWTEEFWIGGPGTETVCGSEHTGSVSHAHIQDV